MKKKFVNYCMSIIETNNKNLSNKEIDKMRYGLEGLYLTITKITVVFIISLLLGTFKETLILLLLFNVIRYTAFGVHAKRSLDCFISSTIFFVGFPLICINVIIPNYIKYILFIPIILLIGIYAPSDTQKRPLKNKKKREIYKILSVIITVVYIILSLVITNNTISNCFLFALIIQVIVILPITYKIFGVSYNNYKKYEAN